MANVYRPISITTTGPVPATLVEIDGQAIDVKGIVRIGGRAAFDNGNRYIEVTLTIMASEMRRGEDGPDVPLVVTRKD